MKTFRYATDEDARFFLNLLINQPKELFYLGIVSFEMETFRQDAYHAALVVEVDGKVAGFSVLQARDLTDFNYLASFYILKKFRRQGVGTKLLEFSEKYIKANWPGVGIDLYTNDNDPMEALLKKNGYKLSGYYKKKRFKHGKFSGQSRWIKIYK